MSTQRIIGVDLAKHVFQVCVVNARGELLSNRAVKRAKLQELIAAQPPALIVMEACGGAHDWARRFQGGGHRVRLIASQYVVPFRTGQKNDANDALALTVAARQPSVPAVPVKSVAQQDLQSLHRVRQRLVKTRTALSNQIRGLLLEYGVVLPRSHARLRQRLPEILEDGENALSGAFRALLAELHEEWLGISQRLAAITRRLRDHAHGDERCRRLMAMEGVGPMIATALIAALGDGHCWRNGRHTAAWLGLVPRQRSSGGRARLQGLSKRGDVYLRTLLIHGARAVITHLGAKQDSLSRWLRALVARVGVNRACVGLANKMARVAWALLSSGAVYRKPAVVPNAA